MSANDWPRDSRGSRRPTRRSLGASSPSRISLASRGGMSEPPRHAEDEVSPAVPSLRALRRAAPPDVFARGEEYFAQERVRGLVVDAGGSAAATVRGSADYRVRLSLERGVLRATCTCPFAADRAFCKHAVAAGSPGTSGSVMGRYRSTTTRAAGGPTSSNQPWRRARKTISSAYCWRSPARTRQSWRTSRGRRRRSSARSPTPSHTRSRPWAQTAAMRSLAEAASAILRMSSSFDVTTASARRTAPSTTATSTMSS